MGLKVVVAGKEYCIGKKIGTGGFGSIHLGLPFARTLLLGPHPSPIFRSASRQVNMKMDDKAEYAIKFELESSGGLFSEMNSFRKLRLCEWDNAGQYLCQTASRSQHALGG